MTEAKNSLVILQGRCAGSKVCPLSRVRAGEVVAIRQLCTGPELADRLRELGLREDEKIRLVTQDSNLICEVCNARLGISQAVAECIFVEPVAA